MMENAVTAEQERRGQMYKRLHRASPSQWNIKPRMVCHAEVQIFNIASIYSVSTLDICSTNKMSNPVCNKSKKMFGSVVIQKIVISCNISGNIETPENHTKYSII